MAYELTKSEWKLVDNILASVEGIAKTAIGLSVVKSDMKPMYKLMTLGMISGGFKRLKEIRRGVVRKLEIEQEAVPVKCVGNPEKERQENSNEEPDVIPKRVMNRIGF